MIWQFDLHVLSNTYKGISLNKKMHIINEIGKKIWKDQPSLLKANFSSSFISLLSLIVILVMSLISFIILLIHFGNWSVLATPTFSYNLLPQFYYFLNIFPNFVHAATRPLNSCYLMLWEVLYVVFFTNWFTVFCSAGSKCGNVFLSKTHYLCYYQHSNSGTGDSCETLLFESWKG